SGGTGGRHTLPHGRPRPGGAEVTRPLRGRQLVPPGPGTPPPAPTGRGENGTGERPRLPETATVHPVASYADARRLAADAHFGNAPGRGRSPGGGGGRAHRGQEELTARAEDFSPQEIFHVLFWLQP